MTTATRSLLTEPASEELLLPFPPTDAEKYAYVRPAGIRQRWLMSTSILSGLFFAFRAFSHIPTLTSIPTLIVGGTLLIWALISAATSLLKARNSMAEHIGIINQYRPQEWPSIAVFLPSAGEDMEILYNTYQHVSSLEWPGQIRVYALDDSDRDSVREAARRYGFQYHVRENRGYMKKAGNLLHGFNQLADEDFILVLDADFAPRPDMLREMIPYFYQGNRVGIVQSPQFFDTGGGMNWLQSGAGAIQEYFYRWVQPSRDRLGSPICVGTCAIYSVAGLRSVGGFAQIEHSEDVHTGVKLRKDGYLTRYVPINLAKGLCPDDLRGFINQQYRWCAGSMSLMRSLNFHKIKMGLGAKLCFWSGFLYYIATAILVIGTPVTMSTMLLLHRGPINPILYYAMVPILIFTLVLIPKALHARWGLEVLRVQYIYSFAHNMAIFDTFLRNKTAGWVPTGAVKKGSRLDRRVKVVMFTWTILANLALWGSFTFSAVHNGINEVWPYLLLIGLQSMIQIPVLLPLRSPYARRDRIRRVLTSPSRLLLIGAALVSVGVMSGCGSHHSNETILPVPPSYQVATSAAPNSATTSIDFTGSAGTKAPSKYFTYQVGGNGWGNNELETYTNRASNASLDGSGNLVITARRETYAGPDGITRNWTSARLTTQNKLTFKYGTLSARIKMDPAKGGWYAFWLMGQNIGQVGWPVAGEIDIAETQGPLKVYSICLHSGLKPGHAHRVAVCSIPHLSQDLAGWHVWSITKEPGFVQVSQDGRVLLSIHKSQVKIPWPYDQPMFLTANVALGSGYAGNPNSSTPDQFSMSINYIRITK